MRKRKRPYKERTFSRNRTISVQKSAGTKRPRLRNSPPEGPITAEGRELVTQLHRRNAPPMNLRPKSAGEFMDIETCFHSSSLMRAMSGRAPLARKYT